VHLRALAPGAVRIRRHGRPELLQLRQAVKLYLELHADPASSGAAGLLRAPAGVTAAVQSGESWLGVMHFLRSRQATLETHAGRGPCLQARLWHANSAAQNLGVVLCQTRPAANVPHPVLQQRRSVQLDAIPAGRPSHVDSFQPPHRQQLKSQYIEQNQAATHLISMHQRAFIEHVVEHLHRLAACRVARSRCCDEVALRQVRNRQPLWTIGARIDQVDLSKAG